MTLDTNRQFAPDATSQNDWGGNKSERPRRCFRVGIQSKGCRHANLLELHHTFVGGGSGHGSDWRAGRVKSAGLRHREGLNPSQTPTLPSPHDREHPRAVSLLTTTTGSEITLWRRDGHTTSTKIEDEYAR